MTAYCHKYQQLVPTIAKQMSYSMSFLHKHHPPQADTLKQMLLRAPCNQTTTFSTIETLRPFWTAHKTKATSTPLTDKAALPKIDIYPTDNPISKMTGQTNSTMLRATLLGTNNSR
jgi:hypothetical protein